MSFLTAIGNIAGGYGQGADTRARLQLAREQQQQTGAYEQSQIQAEQERLAFEKQQATQQAAINRAKLTAGGYDQQGNPLPPLPINLPPSLQRVVPGKVGTKYQVTPEDQINHQIAIYRYQAQQYRNAGRTDYADALDANADKLESAMVSETGLTQRMLLDYYNQGEMDRRNQKTTTALLSRGMYPYEYVPQGDIYRAQHPTGGASKQATVATKQASQAYNDFKQLYGNYTKVPAGPVSGIAPIDPKTGKPMTATINAAQQQVLDQDFAALDTSANPEKDVAGMIKGVTNQAVVKTLKAYARYRAAQKRAEDATNAENTGGSDVNGNPPPLAYPPP